MDGVRITAIEQQDVGAYLADLHQAWQTGTYRPRRSDGSISPKQVEETPPARDSEPPGPRRPSGVKIVREPIVEADFQAGSYRFRPKWSAHDALAAIRQGAHYGYPQGIARDLASFFDTVPHGKLPRVLRQRIRDDRVRGWIWRWLKAGVREGTTLEPNRLGTPQGS